MLKKRRAEERAEKKNFKHRFNIPPKPDVLFSLKLLVSSYVRMATKPSFFRVARDPRISEIIAEGKIMECHTQLKKKQKMLPNQFSENCMPYASYLKL